MPGPPGARRHGAGPAPSFPIHIHAIALASANVISLDVRDAAAFLANIARTCESLYPRPKILVSTTRTTRPPPSSTGRSSRKSSLWRRSTASS